MSTENPTPEFVKHIKQLLEQSATLRGGYLATFANVEELVADVVVEALVCSDKRERFGERRKLRHLDFAGKLELVRDAAGLQRRNPKRTLPALAPFNPTRQKRLSTAVAKADVFYKPATLLDRMDAERDFRNRMAHRSIDFTQEFLNNPPDDAISLVEYEEDGTRVIKVVPFAEIKAHTDTVASFIVPLFLIVGAIRRDNRG